MFNALREIFTDPFVLVVLGIAFTALVFGTFAARVLEEQDRQKKKARRGQSDS